MTSTLPYEVKPLGMLFFLSDAEKRAMRIGRERSLGDLGKTFPDRVLATLLEHVDDAKTLMNFSLASKMCFQFASFDSLWKKLYLTKFGLEKADFSEKTSWKELYLGEVKGAETKMNTVGCLYSDALYLPNQINGIEINERWIERFTVPEIDCSGMAETSTSDSIARTFCEEFEKNNLPVVLRGLAKEWKAIKKWETNETLLKEYGEETFLVGGYRTSLKNYISYCLRENNMDDNKLLLFDPKAKMEMWTENTGVSEGLFHELFSKNGDYFKVLGEQKRPHYKWVIFGPSRSGSTFHVDPNGTSAWNAVIRGRKKWIMFPPDEVPPGVFPSEDNANVVCPLTPLEWYENFYDTCYGNKFDEDDNDDGETNAYHFQETICEAGDVLFVPSQWWHCVVNLPSAPPTDEGAEGEDQDKNVHLALTANFVSRSNLPTVLKILDTKNSNLVSGYDDKTQRHSLGEAFEERMRELHPEILREAREKTRANTSPLRPDRASPGTSVGEKDTDVARPPPPPVRPRRRPTKKPRVASSALREDASEVHAASPFSPSSSFSFGFGDGRF